ncbi:MAG: serpin family protein [Thermoflexales bacterium]|nr:serpin family protein [Thermoflexales bacterium]
MTPPQPPLQPRQPAAPAEPLPAPTSLPLTNPTSLPDTPIALKHAEAHQTFAFGLLRELVSRSSGNNVFISPPNIALALGMAANGARGQTLQEMLDLLGKGADLDSLNQDYRALQVLLNRESAGLVLTSGNAAWVRAGVDLYPEYEAQVRKVFGVPVVALDFNSPSAVEAINQWASTATRGRIPVIVEQIPPELVLFLASAIYFKGDWQVKFDERETQDQPFTLADGSQVQVPLMFRSGKFTYLKGDGFQAARLPYADGSMWMTVVVPEEGRTLNDLVAGLTAERWRTWTAQWQPNREGSVFVPRFRMRYDAELSEPLSALGMRQAFDRNAADFSGMRPVPPNLFISFVRHQSFLEVNEQGSEAAAVTSIGVGITAVQIDEQPFVLRADRPFLLMIEDSRVDVPLFIGAIFNPLAEG